MQYKIVAASILAILGVVIQIIALPNWLNNFSDAGYKGGPYIILLSVSCISLLVFIMLIISFFTKDWRKNQIIQFSFKRFFQNGASIGLLGALNGFFVVYSASPSKVAYFMQILLIGASFLETPLMSFLLVGRNRNIQFLKTYFCSCIFYFITFLIVLGLILLLIPYYIHGLSYGLWYYSILFFMGIVFGNVYNLKQEAYLKEFIHNDQKNTENLKVDVKKYTNYMGNRIHSKYSINNQELSSPTEVIDHSVPLIIYLEVLCASSMYQLLFVIGLSLIIPLPFFGDLESYSSLWNEFQDSLYCMFHCKWNLAFFFCYSFGYVITYFGNVILNGDSAIFTILLSTCSLPFSTFAFFVFEENSVASLLFVIPSCILLFVSIALWKWKEIKSTKQFSNQKWDHSGGDLNFEEEDHFNSNGGKNIFYDL